MDDQATNEPKNAQLTKALTAREREYAAALDGVEDVCDADSDARLACRLLREAVELTRVLRRLVSNVSGDEVYRAFGAPGDFGYDTPIGDALHRLYRGDP